MQYKDIRHSNTQNNDTQHNNSQFKDIQQSSTQHYNNQHYDTQYNDNKHNDSKHNDTIDIQHNNTPHCSIKVALYITQCLCSMLQFDHYADCHKANCRHVEC